MMVTFERSEMGFSFSLSIEKVVNNTRSRGRCTFVRIADTTIQKKTDRRNENTVLIRVALATRRILDYIDVLRAPQTRFARSIHTHIII